MFNYMKLWHLLLSKGLKKSDLQKEADISWSAISKMTKRESVSLDVLRKICKYLNCSLEDIIEFDYDENIHQGELVHPVVPCRQVSNKKALFNSIDLFAGIGGIRLGFERAFGDDISTDFVSEWDVQAQKTYIENFNDPFQIAGDITKIKEEDIPAFDICLAGFPCQAFSLAGQRKGFNDIQDPGAIKKKFSANKIGSSVSI